jgi:hypothetical protein
MISLSVSRGGGGVGVGSEVMELCGSIVRTLWHGVPPLILDATFAATASATCSVRLSMMYFALNTSAGPSRGRSIWHRGFVLRTAVLKESPRRARR